MHSQPQHKNLDQKYHSTDYLMDEIIYNIQNSNVRRVPCI